MSFDPSAPPLDDDCPFCRISKTYPAYDPLSVSPDHAAPRAEQPNLDPYQLSPAAFVVLSTDLCVAFLDIMPLAPGHLLVTTRAHNTKISDVSSEESKELGYWLPILSRAMAIANDCWDYNIIQNNGAAAAQVVPHVHFHIIPRPALTEELRNKSFTMFGRGQRSDLDETEAEDIARRFREELAREVARMQSKEKL